MVFSARRLSIGGMVLPSILSISILSASIALAGQAALLDVAGGQIPNDTGSDGGTKLSIEDTDVGPAKAHKLFFAHKALKVVFAPGDSFGDRQAKIADWTPFKRLEFTAYNMSQEPVRLTLTVRHGGTTDFATRIDFPFVLQPRSNEVKIELDSLRNNGGGAPDLSTIGKWYIACEQGKAPTLFFSSISLVSEGAGMPQASVAGIGSDETAPNLVGAGEIKPVRTGSKMPRIARPIAFNTPEADAVMTALQVFPPSNPWNQAVDKWPLHPNSRNIIASIGANKPLRGNNDMGFILVPPNQPRINVRIVMYASESDRGPYPVPDNTPIEGWPGGSRDDPRLARLTLDDMQRDRLGTNSDRHAIVVDPAAGIDYEFYQMKKTNAGWQCAQASIFDLKSNRLRPDGWTSTDAAGLPILPAIVRYDEIRRGMVEHAMRVTVVHSRKAYIAPATHLASSNNNPNLPRMGERIRLRKDFDISGFSPAAQAILKGLKKYGMLVADNGQDWAISIAPDERIPVLHQELRKVPGAAFEVVVAPK